MGETEARELLELVAEWNSEADRIRAECKEAATEDCRHGFCSCELRALDADEHADSLRITVQRLCPGMVLFAGGHSPARAYAL